MFHEAELLRLELLPMSRRFIRDQRLLPAGGNRGFERDA